MPTVPPSPLASALARLRAPAGRLRRWLASRGTITRVALMLLGLGALGALGYLASIGEPTEPAWAWICERRKLSSDDVDKISEALDAADIPHVADPLGRIGVKPSKRQEALALLIKKKLVPPSLADLVVDDDPVNHLLEMPGDRERRENSQLERMLKRQIEGLDSIALALVQIHRVKKRAGLATSSDVSASVYVQTEGDRALGYRVVEGIRTFLIKDVPDLKPDAITVVDHLARRYLVAGDPSLKDQIHTHAREEDWQDKILEELRHIPGVGVSVQLETVPPPPPPAPVPPPAVALEVVRPNGQVELAQPAPPPVASFVPPTPPLTRANVWVRVPRSFYLLDFQSRSPGRQPTQDDLELMRLTADKVIRDAVEIHIPKEDLGGIKIAVIQDDLTSTRPLMLPSSPETVRPWTWVALSAGVSAASMLAVAGLVRLATRRPSNRPSRSAWRADFVSDGPSGPVPGPSERVRELIRLNPEAAAGVLQRWIGQGGPPR
jgi:type III secretory pathway lipoprotein EscJ